MGSQGKEARGIQRFTDFELDIEEGERARREMKNYSIHPNVTCKACGGHRFYTLSKKCVDCVRKTVNTSYKHTHYKFKRVDVATAMKGVWYD